MRIIYLSLLLPAAAMFSACDVWGTSSHLLPGDGATADGDVDGGDDAHHDAGQDGGYDAGYDAGHDGGFDGGYDAGYDAGHDGGLDGGYDAGYDAGHDGGFDGGYDAGYDAGHDGGFDGGQDAGPDGGFDGGDTAGCTLTQSAFVTLPMPLGTGQPSALAVGNFGVERQISDLAVGTSVEKKIAVYFDLSLDSPISFSAIGANDLTENPQKLVVIDIPGGEGLDDLAALTTPIQSGQPVHVLALKNNGNQSFEPIGPVTFVTNYQSGPAYSLDVGKFSGDSAPDLMAACSDNCNQAGIFPWDSDLETFDTIMPTEPGNPVDTLTVSDLDQNGQDDLVAGISYMSTGHAIKYGLANGGPGVFDWHSVADIGASNLTRDLAVADFDGDGVADLAALVVASSQFQLWSYRGNSSGGQFSGFSSSHTTLELGTGYSLVRLKKGDFNRDGKPDLALLAVVSPSPSNVRLLINNSTGSGIAFQDLLTLQGCPSAASGKDLVVHDFDGNGADDIAVACAETESSILFLRNDCH